MSRELSAFSNRRRNLVYFITYLGYASIYLARINLSMASPDLKAAGVLTTVQLGYLGTAFSVVYAAGRLLNSLQADGVEPRTMIGIGLIGTGLASIGVSFLPPFYAVLALWCVNAFAQSMLWSSVLRIVHALYEDGKIRTARLSLIVSTVTAGQVAGILLSMVLLNHLGLCWVFLFPGLITLLLGGIVLAVYPLIDKRQVTVASNETVPEAAEEKNPLRKMQQVLGLEEVRLALLPGVCMGLLKDNVTLWMAVYFVDTYGIDLQSTTGYVLFIPLVGLAARLLFPVSLKICGGNEHKVSLWSFAGALAASLVLVLVKDPLVAVIALSLVYAFMSLTNSSMLSIFPARYAEQGCMAAVSGCIDFVAYLGAGLGSTVFGHTIEAFGYGTMFAAWAVLAAVSCFVMRKLSTGRDAPSTRGDVPSEAKTAQNEEKHSMGNVPPGRK